MRFRIHRGANEIGGNCIEVQASGKSLLLDLGWPISVPDVDKSLLPSVNGLAEGDNPDLLGVVISHPHMDHYGLLEHAHPSIPTYAGEGAEKLLRIAAPFMVKGAPTQTIQTYKNRKMFRDGPLCVTPFLMDHSAFDAYALLIEADGHRLFYSGDFRGHGRKASVFKAFLKNPPANVDILLMAGTVLGRNGSEAAPTEAELENRIATAITDTPGLVLTCFSPQNVDRFVTFFRATRRAGRRFIADVYTACILDGLKLASLPSPRNSDIRVFLPNAQKRRIMRTQRFDLVEPYRQQRIYPSQIATNPERWVMMFRSSMIRDAETIGALDNGKLIYSLWPGYLDRETPDLRKWCAANGLSFEIQHTSGHADIEDLKRLAEAIAPHKLVPMHTVRPKDYAQLFANVERYPDGEWVEITNRSKS